MILLYNNLIYLVQSTNVHAFYVKSKEIGTISPALIRNKVIVPKETLFLITTETSQSYLIDAYKFINVFKIFFILLNFFQNLFMVCLNKFYFMSK